MQEELTPTEVRICELTAAGLTNIALAAKLGKSPLAAKQAVSKLYRKLGVCSRAELIVLSLHRGVVSLADIGAAIEKRAAVARRANGEFQAEMRRPPVKSARQPRTAP